jgi:hypothetical protein
MKRISAALLILFGLASAALAQTLTIPPPAGVMIMGCVYNASPPVLATGTAGYVQCDSQGSIGAGGGGGGLSVEDQAAWTQGTSNFTPGGGVFNDAASLSSGEQGTYRLTTKRAQVVDVDTSGNALYDAITSSIPAGTNYIGRTRATDGTLDAVLNPCEANTQSYAPISITTATTTRIVAPSASNKTYICSLFLTSAAADNIGIVEGTGGTCGSGTAGVIGGTTAANGPNFAANGGMMLQAGGKVAVAQTAGTNVDLCLITSAATPLAGGIKYVQAP